MDAMLHWVGGPAKEWRTCLAVSLYEWEGDSGRAGAETAPEAFLATLRSAMGSSPDLRATEPVKCVRL